MRLDRCAAWIGLGVVGWWCGSCASGGRVAAPPAGEPAVDDGLAVLVAEVPVEGRLEPGDEHEYGLDLADGRLVRLSVEQRRGDVAVALFGPDGALLAEADQPGRPWLEERLSAITRVGGRYGVRIRSAPGQDRAAAYRLLVAAPRSVAAADGQRIVVEKAIQNARGMLESPDEERRRAAVPLLESARRLAQAAGDAAAEGRALHYQGDALTVLDEREPALEAYELALARRQVAGDRVGVAETLLFTGQTLHYLGRGQEALDCFARALTAAEAAGDLRLQALTLQNAGALAFTLGRPQEALEGLARAVELFEAAGDPLSASGPLISLGVVHRYLGQPSRALEVYRRALPLVEELGDVVTELTLLNNLGVSYRARGEAQRALETYTRALRRAEETGHRERAATLASNLGSLYWRLGDCRLGLAQQERALALYRQLDNPGGEAGELMRIGWLLETCEDAERALEYFRQALPISRQAGDRRIEGQLLHSLGRVQLTQGNTGAALAYLEEALALQEESSDRSGLVGTLRDLAAVREEQGDGDGARELLWRSLALSRELEDPYNEAATRSRLAAFERRHGDLTTALSEIRAAIALNEEQRSDLASPDLRATFLSGRRTDYAFLADLLMELDRRQPGGRWAAAAFEASERSRARSLVELLTEAQVNVREGIAPELREQERRLTARLWALQAELVRERAAEEQRLERVEELRGELATVRQQREELEWRVRREHPRYAEMLYPEPPAVAAVQGLLEPDAALLEFLLGAERSHLFVLTATEFAVFELPPGEEISALVRTARLALGEARGRARLGVFIRAARQLYERLLGPAEAILADRRSLTIVADGELHYLPFEALVAERQAPPEGAGTPPFLIYRWSVSYVPSAAVLSSLRHEAPPARVAGDPLFVGFADPPFGGAGEEQVAVSDEDLARTATVERGPPAAGIEQDPLLGDAAGAWRWRRLPASRREVEAIAALYPSGASTLFVGAAASERRLKTSPEVRGARYLHVASHAVINERQPAYSSLLMSRGQADGEDGLLQVHEIFNLRLSAELVVLSACETALGRQVSGEGLVGLSRAFFFAGARAVTVSLSPVPDLPTADLMVEFYRALDRGASKIEALREAKLAQIRSGRVLPYYWAPFVLVGDPL